MKQVVSPAEDRRVCQFVSSLIPWGRHLCAKASGSSSHTRDTSFIKEHHILVQKHHLGGSEWTAPARQKLFKFSLPWCAKLKTVVFGSPEWSAVGKCNSACLSSTSRSPYKHITKQCFEGRKKGKSHSQGRKTLIPNQILERVGAFPPLKEQQEAVEG